MDNVVEIETKTELSFGLQLSRVLFAATVAFCAGKVAEKVFDKVVEAKFNTSLEN